MASSRSITASALTYRPLWRALSRERRPRATKACWNWRRSTFSRMDCSTKPERVSPSCRISSAALRSSALTRTAGKVAVLWDRSFALQLRCNSGAFEHGWQVCLWRGQCRRQTCQRSLPENTGIESSTAASSMRSNAGVRDGLRLLLHRLSIRVGSADEVKVARTAFCGVRVVCDMRQPGRGEWCFDPRRSLDLWKSGP